MKHLHLAHQCYKRALALFPKDSSTWNYWILLRDLGYCEVRTGNIKDGELLIDQFLNKFPSSDNFSKKHFNVGKVYKSECLIERNKPEEAIQILD